MEGKLLEISKISQKNSFVLQESILTTQMIHLCQLEVILMLWVLILQQAIAK